MFERVTDDEIRNSELGKLFSTAGNTGYSFEELWKKTNYVERADLSRDISRLSKLRIARNFYVSGTQAAA